MTAANDLWPHNLEAERSLLGCMLRSSAAIGEILQVIREEYFYQDAHQKIFKAIIYLYDLGKPTDTVGVAEVLHQRKEIEDVRYAYLNELLEAIPYAAYPLHHAKIIRPENRGLRIADRGSRLPASILVVANRAAIFDSRSSILNPRSSILDPPEQRPNRPTVHPKTVRQIQRGSHGLD